MAGVHPLVYVGAGAIVSLVSLALGKEFTLFFYVGLCALVFGAIAAFIGGMQYHNAQKMVEKGQQKAQSDVAKKYPDYAQQQMRMNVKYCNRCGMQSHLQANFCQRCGSRV
jgi:ribosomal protein L40E